jgi:hypothetical protein
MKGKDGNPGIFDVDVDGRAGEVEVPGLAGGRMLFWPW